jgi:hypothetical protein
LNGSCSSFRRPVRPQRRGKRHVGTNDEDREAANVEELYTRAYEFFDRGDYALSRKLADECCDRSSNESYWYWGALGLRCWLCNFMDDGRGLEEVAAELISECPAPHRPWFSGLAHLNLALWMARRGGVDQARAAFSAAASAYDKYELGATEPMGWALVLRYFAAVARWKSGAGAQELQELHTEIGSLDQSVNSPEGLREAVELACRNAQGESVTMAARHAVATGVSRAFLAPLLLTPGGYRMTDRRLPDDSSLTPGLSGGGLTSPRGDGPLGNNIRQTSTSNEV